MASRRRAIDDVDVDVVLDSIEQLSRAKRTRSTDVNVTVEHGGSTNIAVMMLVDGCPTVVHREVPRSVPPINVLGGVSSSLTSPIPRYVEDSSFFMMAEATWDDSDLTQTHLLQSMCGDIGIPIV
jgi:hypothetical protein